MIKKTGGLIAILPERQRRTDLAICAMCLALLRYSVKTGNEAKLPGKPPGRCKVVAPAKEKQLGPSGLWGRNVRD